MRAAPPPPPLLLPPAPPRPGRNRYVDYADSRAYNASSIPPEWHSWLHFISDDIPAEMATGAVSADSASQVRAYSHPFYVQPHEVNPTGGPASDVQQPKGSWHNPQHRNWRKYASWNPNPS